MDVSTPTVSPLRQRMVELHLVDEGSSPITLNATISGLKFCFDVTLGSGELMAKMQPVHVPRTMPVVLRRVEVSRPTVISARVLRCRWQRWAPPQRPTPGACTHESP